MLKFYYNLAPNPMKVALMLEETGTPYEAIPVDTRKGEQHRPEFTAINPNGKVPVIVDGDTTVFDSNAIMLYLAENTGQFLPAANHRAETLSWLMFIASGLGPFSGQAVHFKHATPDKIPYAIDRYQFEAERHYRILDAHLANHAYLIGDKYSFVDMTAWGWLRMGSYVLGEPVYRHFAHVRRLKDEITARPAAQRAEALTARHAFKAEMDAEARSHMVQHVKPA